MDRYAVFGLLLLFHLGQAQDMRIDFTSPVMKGDDVNITCTWRRYSHFVQASWYRKTETANEETLYTFYTSGISAEPGFEFVTQHSELNEFSYTIKLVGAKEEDTGTYWCAGKYLVGLSLTTAASNEERLDVTDQAPAVNIYFNSPVTQGDDVTITCTWKQYGEFLQAIWYRQTETKATRDIIYNLYTSGSYDAQPGFEFVSEYHSLTDNSYTIKRVGFKKEDEGTYWCAVKYLREQSLFTFTSDEKRLSVRVPETSTRDASTAEATSTRDATTAEAEAQPPTTGETSETSIDRSIASDTSTTASGLGRYDNTQVENGVDTSAVIGGSVGGVVAVLLLVVIVLLVLLLRRNNKRNSSQSGPDLTASPAQGEPMQQMSRDPQIPNQRTTEQQYEEILVKPITTEQQYETTQRNQGRPEEQYEEMSGNNRTTEQPYDNIHQNQATTEVQYLTQGPESSNYQGLGDRPRAADPVYSDLHKQAGQV